MAGYLIVCYPAMFSISGRTWLNGECYVDGQVPQPTRLLQVIPAAQVCQELEAAV